jgi:hypothetical protein
MTAPTTSTTVALAIGVRSPWRCSRSGVPPQGFHEPPRGTLGRALRVRDVMPNLRILQGATCERVMAPPAPGLGDRAETGASPAW